MDHGACGIMALVASDNLQLHDNPADTLYDKRYRRSTTSQFTYLSRPFTKKNGPPHLLSGPSRGPARPLYA